MIKTITITAFALISLVGLLIVFRAMHNVGRQSSPIATKPASPVIKLEPGYKKPERIADLLTTSGYPVGLKVDILDKDCFLIGYYEPAEQPAWAMYALNGKVKKLSLKRSNNFYEDGFVESGSATPKDYRHSGYDRGHLVPAADMKTDATCFANSFLLSNISPQNHEFNTGRKSTKKKTVKRRK